MNNRMRIYQFQKRQQHLQSQERKKQKAAHKYLLFVAWYVALLFYLIYNK